MFAVSLRGNYLFGYSLGQNDEKRQLFAWANVAADVWKAFGLLAVSMLWRKKQRRAASVASVAWFVCLLFGINSAIGVYVQDRSALTGSREAQHATYKDAEKELTIVEGKLRGLAKHRSIGEIEAAIGAIMQRAVVAGERVRGSVAIVSQNCTKLSAHTSEACGEVGQLREELATAAEAKALQARETFLREQVTTLRNIGSSITPDPVGEFYAWITRGLVSVRDVGFGFPLFFALLIEVVSAFGAITIAAYAEATAPSIKKSDTASAPEPAAASSGPLQQAAARSALEDEAVLTWIAERATPTTDTRAIRIDKLHEDYMLWCQELGYHASSIDVFETAFDRARDLPDLTGKICKFGKRYYGIALVQHAMHALSARDGRTRERR